MTRTTHVKVKGYDRRVIDHGVLTGHSHEVNGVPYVEVRRPMV